MRLKLLIILGGLTTSCFAYLNDTDGSTHHDGIYGGEEIEPGSRPYLVSLGKGSSGLGQFCGGSLISKHAILTAAHCVTEYDENDGSLSWNPPEWVELRRHNLCDDTEDFVRVHLDQTQCSGDVVFHPEYNGTTDDNDVAIVFLSNAIDDIVPVILNSDPNVPAVDDPLDVAGWGEVDDGSYPVIPSSVTLYYLTNEACMSKPFKWGWWMITDNMMCAFAKKKSSCHGDSGGPLVLGKAEPESGPMNPVVQVGIVSFGIKKGCALNRYPAVYTRITSVIDWIRDTVCGRTGELCKESKRKRKEGSIRRAKSIDGMECEELPEYVPPKKWKPAECVAQEPPSKPGKPDKKPKSGKSKSKPKSAKKHMNIFGTL